MAFTEEISNTKKLPRKGRAKIKVLIVFANPHTTNALRLGTEDRVIREAIKLSPYRANISLTICHATTVHDLRRSLLNENFQIVHISGHGSEAGLVFEDEIGREHILPQRALANLFQAYSPPIECVILNACYSISQGLITSLGIPITIAMDGPIDDDAAIEFARGFYDAIGAGKGCDFAYEEGCRTVMLARPEAQFVSEILKTDNNNDTSNETRSTATVSISIPATASISMQSSESLASEGSRSSPDTTDSSVTDAKVAIGDMLETLEDYEGALDAYNEAITLNPNSPAACNSKGSVLQKLNRYDEAIAAYKEALRLDPAFVATYFNLGLALYELERYDEAIAAYKEAVKLDPDDAIAYYNLSLTLYELERYDEALAAAKEAVKLDPDANNYSNMGSILIQLARYDEAIAAYKELLRLDPNDADVHNNLADALLMLNSYEEALKFSQEAILRHPNDAISHETLGEIFQALKRHDEAIAAYKESIRLDPNRGDSYIKIGNLLKSLQSTN